MMKLNNMKKNIHKFISALFLSVFLFPVLVFSAGSGNNTGLTYECAGTVNNVTVFGNCTFDDLIMATMNLVNKIIPIALGFSVVVIAYAGFQYMASGTNSGARTKANRALQYVAIGIFFMLAAWLIANMIANALIDPNAGVPKII